eukprot:TRINITY_DN824_c0_g1_i9.p1 TRINITY_DN824_c0_g1~~TRINITY_DN824_c0_g1_i9.p1  ORF type:complete len:143 (+),score=34.86 TRINITY_DN824_c0_g1_i9:8-436(+)
MVRDSMKAKERRSTPLKSSATSGCLEMPSMHRPEAIPCPTPEPMAASPIANPAPTAERAGIQTLPSAACAAVGVTMAAALRAAVGNELTVAGCAALVIGAGTKALKRAQHETSTAVVRINERGADIFDKKIKKQIAGDLDCA